MVLLVLVVGHAMRRKKKDGKEERKKERGECEKGGKRMGGVHEENGWTLTSAIVGKNSRQSNATTDHATCGASIYKLIYRYPVCAL